jgi:hypothetical protein
MTQELNLCLPLRRRGSRALILTKRETKGQEDLKANPEFGLIRWEIDRSESPLSPRELCNSTAYGRFISNSGLFRNFSWGTWASSFAICLAGARIGPSRVKGIAHTKEDSYNQTMA